jgi:hypothetical protein
MCCDLPYPDWCSAWEMPRVYYNWGWQEGHQPAFLDSGGLCLFTWCYSLPNGRSANPTKSNRWKAVYLGHRDRISHFTTGTGDRILIQGRLERFTPYWAQILFVSLIGLPSQDETRFVATDPTSLDEHLSRDMGSIRLRSHAVSSRLLFGL